jgi:hypothetical protein
MALVAKIIDILQDFVDTEENDPKIENKLNFMKSEVKSRGTKL